MGEKIDNPSISNLKNKRVYFDTNVFIYFLEADESFSSKTYPFFEMIAQGKITGVASDAVLAELLVKPIREKDTHNILVIQNLLAQDVYFEMISHNREMFKLAAKIRAENGLKMIDALHVATAILSKCDYFLTEDIQILKRITNIEVIGLTE